MDALEKIKAALMELTEEKYRSFSASLMPTVDIERVLGVRLPKIRALAKSLSVDEIDCFLSSLPHEYFEEYMLHAMKA